MATKHERKPKPPHSAREATRSGIAASAGAGTSPGLLTVHEAAERLRVSNMTIYRLINQGLPAYRIGRTYRLDRQKLEEWLEGRRTDGR